MRNQIAILIINYNLKKDSIDCIRSLEQAGAALGQIYLIDNHSTDESVSEIGSCFGPELNIWVNDKNLGYAGAINSGLQRILDQGYAWLLIMNNDTVVAGDFLEKLLSAANNHPDVLIWSPAIYSMQHPDIIWHLGSEVIPGTLLTRDPYRGKKNLPAEKDAIPIVFAHGTAMLIHRDVFSKIGLFDDSFFMYAEEIDFCWRAHQVGILAAGAVQAKMWHKVSASSSRNKSKTNYLRIRNQIIFYRRYSHGLMRLNLLLFTFLRSLLLAGKALIQASPETTKSILNGWYDGWFQKLPQRT
jgi:GT2 family glycosyltransferase